MHATFQLASTPARAWTVAEVMVLTSRMPLGEFALQGLTEEAVIAFPKACLHVECAQKNKTPPMLVYGPAHLGKGQGKSVS